MRTVEVGDFVFLRANRAVEKGKVIKRHQNQVWFEDSTTKDIHFSWSFQLRYAGTRRGAARWVHFTDFPPL
jgi:hypothetical protein